MAERGRMQADGWKSAKEGHLPASAPASAPRFWTASLVLACVSVVLGLAAVGFGLRAVADSLGWWAFVSTPFTSAVVLCLCLIWRQSPAPLFDRPLLAAVRLWFVATLFLRCMAQVTSDQPLADLTRTLAVAFQVAALYLVRHEARQAAAARA